MASIKCYHCGGKHELVSQVKDCAKVPAAFAAKAALPAAKTVEVVIPAKVTVSSVPAHRLDPKYLALKALQIPHNPAGAAQTVAAVTVAESIAAGNAAALVQFVKIPGLDISVPAPVQTTAAVKTGQDIECGMYQTVHPETGAITIYKVKFNKAGTHKLAEKLSITGGHYGDKPKGKFWYAPGMMAKLTSENKMTEEQAKAFHDATKAKYGVDYGFCCVCGKLLTVKKSIDAGIGPVCVTKF